jgi:hypothetical protein
MKLGHSADEIKYEKTLLSIATYLVILDGEPTMRIHCNTAAPEKVIRIASADGKVSMDTKGTFKMTEVFTEDADGMPLGVEARVDEKSVYTYVVPRLHVLLGRLLRAAA